MKKVLTVGIGGRSFTIDEDAYQRLNRYLEKFRERTGMGAQAKDVMSDLEERIAELFTEALGSGREVVSISLVNKIISQLGMPDGEPMEDDFGIKQDYGYRESSQRKYYRDSDDKMLGGVCSGLSHYINIDVVIIRVIFVIALFAVSLGFWAYLIFWIVSTMAYSATQKCEMRGIPVTAENLRKFSSDYKK